MFNSFFQKSCRFGDVEDGRAREDTHDNTAHARGMLDNYGYKNSLRICNTFCFSATIMTARTRLNVTVHVR